MFTCDAGRRAFFGGRWRVACDAPANHVIGADRDEDVGAFDPIRLCDRHFHEVAAAGLVTTPNVGQAEFARRYGFDPWKAD